MNVSFRVLCIKTYNKKKWMQYVYAYLTGWRNFVETWVGDSFWDVNYFLKIWILNWLLKGLMSWFTLVHFSCFDSNCFIYHCHIHLCLYWFYFDHSLMISKIFNWKKLIELRSLHMHWMTGFLLFKLSNVT